MNERFLEGRELLTRPGGEIEVILRGSGSLIVIIPSLGRGGDDYAQLTDLIARAGYRTAVLQPRGLGASTAPIAGLTLHDFGGDVAAVIEQFDPEGAVVVGHGYGARIARVTATDRPDIVRAVVILAAAGRRAVPADVMESVRKSADLSLPENDRLRHLQHAFFAPGNNPAVWLDGWVPALMQEQLAASQRTPAESYIAAGTAPILLLQPAQDNVAPLQYAHLLKDELGARVTLAVIEHAGHAAVPEQPAAIAQAIVEYMKALA